MNNSDKLLQSIGEIDDDLIAEADFPEEESVITFTKIPQWKIFAPIVAAACMVIAFSVFVLDGSNPDFTEPTTAPVATGGTGESGAPRTSPVTAGGVTESGATLGRVITDGATADGTHGVFPATTAQPSAATTQPAGGTTSRVSGGGTAVTTPATAVSTSPKRTLENALIKHDDPGNAPLITGPGRSRETEILRAYAAWLNAAARQSWLGGGSVKADELYIRTYYGRFNGYDVVTVYGKDWGGTDDMKPIVIEGHMVAELTSGSFDVMVYTGETFVEIQEAYKQGLLRYNDLRTMTLQRIRRSCAFTLYWSRIGGTGTFNQEAFNAIYNNVRISHYFGSFGGIEVVIMYENDVIPPPGTEYADIAGFRFLLGSGQTMKIVGHFDDLKAEYERGHVPKGIIEEIYARFFNADYRLPDELQSNGRLAYRYNHNLGGLEIMGLCWENQWAARFYDSHLNIVIGEEIDGIPVRGIGELAFAGMNAFQSVSFSLPNGLTHIENMAFAWIQGLSRVTVPDSVVYTGLRAFER
jgi:hypothetical protein